MDSKQLVEPMETKPNFILPLPDACAELSLVGGKGASLARMAAAVMATGVATRRIHKGQMVTVDGTIGTVTLA